MILNKDVLVNNILTELSDNSTGQISPYDVRHNLLDIIDSVHLLTKGYPLDGSNFSTRATRTTRVGEYALSKMELAGYFSIDNTAVGHSSLKSNYQGVKNTAIGSNALFCNIYGEQNAAIGYSSLGGNTIGIGNVGIGNFTLNNSKSGNFNIAIGHAAGYYATDLNNKLFIASHNIDSDYICDNPLGSGLTPLVYGDLSELKFGIAVSSLHSDGTLQVSGDITPAYDSDSNLGSPSYNWDSVYLSNNIVFNPNLYIGQLNTSNIEVKGNILPQAHNTYNIGSQSILWNNGYFNNLYISGIATINRLVALEHCNYFCKTINLASSGNVSLDGGGAESLYDYSNEENPIQNNCGYLSDSDLTGAGFNVQASGNGYLRTYFFTFAPSGNLINCLQDDNVYSRSSWNSNISLHLASGTHLATDRVVFPSSINIVNDSGCFGIFSRKEDLFFSYEDVLNIYHPSGHLAGVGNVNFYAASGSSSDYIINFASPESGVIIKQRFLNGIKSKQVDALNNNQDKLNGFELRYVDNSDDLIYGPTSDRLIIGSYNNTSKLVNAVSIMKTDQSEGLFGITNLSPNSENILPETSLNIRSATNAIGRFTAENQSSTKAAIQLLGTTNCLADGFEAAYLNGSGMADVSMYRDSGREVYIRFYEGIDDDLTPGLDYYHLGILNTISGSINSSSEMHGMISLGSHTNNYASISMKEYKKGTPTFVSYPNYKPAAKANRGIYFIGEKAKALQQHSMFMVDGSGNVHDLVVNPYDVTDGRGLYTDPSGNTFGGLYCPDRRDDINGPERNTGLGNRALYSITTGDDNSVYGANSASGLTTGSRNTIIGTNNAKNITTASDNIVIGNNSFNNSIVSSSNNIVIGNGGVGNSVSGDYNFLLGSSSSSVLLHGILGPSNTDKYLSMPSGGKFIVNDSTNSDGLQLRANRIEVLDRAGNDYPDNSLVFSFIGNNSGDLLSLNHSANPMTNNPLYVSPAVSRPYAQLDGDIRLRGSIRFSDYTSLSSSSFLDNINILESGVDSLNQSVSYLLGSFVEGYVNNQINAPNNPSAPSTGILNIKNNNWQDIGQVTLVNRDTTSTIHAGAYVVAIRVNNEFRPLWISASDTKCQCCR
jgi:hypothetical protein